MAFTTTIQDTRPMGGLKVVIGQWATDTTGGDIETGLNTVLACFLQYNKSSVVSNAPVCNETFPLNNAGGNVTIVVDNGEDGSFVAYGI